MKLALMSIQLPSHTPLNDLRPKWKNCLSQFHILSGSTMQRAVLRVIIYNNHYLKHHNSCLYFHRFVSLIAKLTLIIMGYLTVALI
jgi:hypothetical protein